LRIALAKALARNPYFRDNEWTILAIIAAVSIVWIISAEAIKKRQEAPKQVKPAVPRSELFSAFSELVTALRGYLRRKAVPAPKALRATLVLCVIVLVIAIVGDMPYDYFILLRVLIFVTGIVVLTAVWKAKRTAGLFWLVVAMLVIYNPIAPLHLHKDTWIWVNLLTVPLLGLLWLMCSSVA
jgi:hypothetical protein